MLWERMSRGRMTEIQALWSPPPNDEVAPPTQSCTLFIPLFYTILQGNYLRAIYNSFVGVRIGTVTHAAAPVRWIDKGRKPGRKFLPGWSAP